jgi:hypothetical protein
MSERKPSWLSKLAQAGRLGKLTAHKCPGCGHWTIQSRDNIWETYDAGIITRDDITIAIILNKPLTRIHRISGLNQISLQATFGAAGISPDGEYLAYHDCATGAVSARPFVFRKREKASVSMAWPEVVLLPEYGDQWAARLAVRELTLL